MYSKIQNQLENTINEIREAGLYKSERVIESPQEARIEVNDQEVLNMCANNYLGLSDDRQIVEAAHKALDEWGYGLSSVRFICGTQTIHKQLEAKISEFLGMEDTILYTSCFDANGGLFETILSEEDAVISDELNHASIIDGIRLCKAQRFRYRNGDMNDLEEKLKEARGARNRLIATDGVFSMDGYIAKLPEICDLAAKYDAMMVVIKSSFETLNSYFLELLTKISAQASTYETSLLESYPLYKNIVTGVNDSSTIIPPSGAVVGCYAATDRDRGVWKAPANVSLNSVVNPTEIYDALELDALNIDVNGGKSINAIRAFTGKGTLIWGARTLAGNDNEWRYIPVRRFYNMVEESIKKSTYWAVFEPNNANTWVKVKGMIDNYLTNKWKDGALVGAKPDDAFFVKIGLGTTMSAQDILEGRMNVEIGMAVVRPAEFIILKFSHMLQKS